MCKTYTNINKYNTIMQKRQRIYDLTCPSPKKSIFSYLRTFSVIIKNLFTQLGCFILYILIFPTQFLNGELIRYFSFFYDTTT